MPRDADGLTPKQRRFVEEYAKDLNATQACIRAGYAGGQAAEVMGSKLLRLGKIRTVVAKAQAKHAEETGTTVDWVLAALKENAERGMQRIPVLDAAGKETGEWRWEGGVANKALELIGKHRGMFTEKVEHSGGLTIEQLLHDRDSRKRGD